MTNTMHRVILMLLLASINSYAATHDETHYTSHRAVWTEVGINEDGAIVYANPISIRKSGNRVKMWILHDYKNVRNTLGLMSLSSRLLNEYDCKGKQVMTRLFYVHSKNMGRGEATELNGEHCCWWSQLLPGTINKSLWKFACGK